MLKKRILSLFLVGLLLASVLTACGDGKPQADPNSDKTSDSGEMVPGGAITVGISQDLGDSLDPYHMTAAGTREVLFNVYEGLIKPDKDGNFIPAVAEAYHPSEDGLSYTFTLRENVKFHNGNGVTADDVKKSFETCAATTVDNALAAALSAVSSIETPDEKTVVITLTEPNGDLPSFIASVYIVPADATGLETAPIGTGPFQFVSRTVQESLVLEKFSDYYGEGAILDQVTFKVFENASAMMSALGAGSLDMAIHLTLDQVSTLDAGTYQTLEGTMNLVQALYLNHAKAPFDNEKVRQALCYGVDVDALLSFTADGHGTRVGTSIYPAFGKYFDESLASYYSYDPEKAKALLTEAGYPDGFSMTISVPGNYTPHVNTAEVLAEQLSQVGITATIEQVEWQTWLDRIYTGRDFESTVIGFDATVLSANALLGRWVSDDGKNMINYHNPAYDALMASAAAAQDEAQRTALYKEAAQMLTETAANVYIQDLADFVVMKTNLRGYEFYPLYVMDLSKVHFIQ